LGAKNRNPKMSKDVFILFVRKGKVVPGNRYNNATRETVV
jgi:hypothetical protein